MTEEAPETPTAVEAEEEYWRDRKAYHDRWAAWCLLGILVTAGAGVLSLNWTWGLPGWLRGLVLGCVWALPALMLAMALIHLCLLTLCASIFRDVETASELMTADQPLTFHTVHWMVTRQRLWKRVQMVMYWLAAEVGTGLLLAALFWAGIRSATLETAGAILMALGSLTFIVLLMRITLFLTASRWLSWQCGSQPIQPESAAASESLNHGDISDT